MESQPGIESQPHGNLESVPVLFGAFIRRRQDSFSSKEEKRLVWLKPQLVAYYQGAELPFHLGV